MNITIRARSFCTMNHTADLLSACAGSACDSRQNQWGAVDISMSTLLWGMLWEALTVNIGVNGISLSSRCGLEWRWHVIHSGFKSDGRFNGDKCGLGMTKDNVMK